MKDLLCWKTNNVKEGWTFIIYSTEELSTMSSRNPFSLKSTNFPDPPADLNILASSQLRCGHVPN